MNRSKWNALASFMAARLKEPSTHAAIASLMILAHFTIAGPTIDAVTGALAGIFSVAAILTEEKPK